MLELKWQLKEKSKMDEKVRWKSNLDHHLSSGMKGSQ